MTSVQSKRGRPRGRGKVPGSGRQKGTPSKLTTDIKSLILARGKPAQFPCDVAAGRKVKVGIGAAEDGKPKIGYAYPKLAERMEVAMILLRKVTPDLKASEVSGPDGGPIGTKLSHLELARTTAFLLTTAAHDADGRRDGAEEGGGAPVVACCDAPPVLQAPEHAFDGIVT